MVALARHDDPEGLDRMRESTDRAWWTSPFAKRSKQRGWHSRRKRGSVMIISSRTPEGQPNQCPVCDASFLLEPSDPAGDAPCPNCGHLVWFSMDDRRVSKPTPGQSEPYRSDVPEELAVIQHPHPVAAGNGPGRVTRSAVSSTELAGFLTASADTSGTSTRRRVHSIKPADLAIWVVIYGVGFSVFREIARCLELPSPTMQKVMINLVVITCLITSLGYCAACLISLVSRRPAHHGPKLISGASASGDLWDRQLDG